MIMITLHHDLQDYCAFSYLHTLKYKGYLSISILMKQFLTFFMILLSMLACGQVPDRNEQIIDSFYRIGKGDQCIPYFENELKKDPKNEQLLRSLGFLQIRNNNLDAGENYYLQALAVNPGCARCYMNLGNVYAARKNAAKATEFFDKAIKTDPADAILYASRSLQKESLGDDKGALEDLNKAVNLDPKKAEFLLDRAAYNSRHGYTSIALSDVNKAVSAEPGNAHALQERASLYFDLKMFKDALKDMNKAISIDSTQSSYYYSRAAIYYYLDQRDKEMADYATAIRLNPNDYSVYYSRAQELYAMEDMDGYCADMKACYALLKKETGNDSLKKKIAASMENCCDTTRPSYYYQRGIADYNLGKFGDAVKIYSEGLKKFPRNSMTLSFRGNAYLRLEEYDKALIDYYASIKNKDNLEADIIANQEHTLIDISSMKTQVANFLAYMQLTIAECKFGLKKYEEALKEVNKGIDMLPQKDIVEAEKYYNVRGNIYMGLGRYNLAIPDFDKAIELKPDFAIAFVNRAIARVNFGSQVKITSYTAGIGMNNGLFNPKWNLPGKTVVKQSDPDYIAAIGDCNKAIKLDPEMAFAWYIRGQVKKAASIADYCTDLKQAKALGFTVEEELMKDCR